MGRLGAVGYGVLCSGLRWLCDDGHDCRPNEIVALCNIGLIPVARALHQSDPFVTEARDFQVAFAPRIAGRLRRSVASSRGGMLDLLAHFQRWSPDFAIGHLEPAAGIGAPAADAATTLRLLLGCGRRVTGLAEMRTGFLTGWYDRSRAWWSDAVGRPSTLLGLGICEQSGIIRGEKLAFHELFESTRGPAHAVFVPDDVLVPCARVVTEQFHRTPAQSQAIAADMARALATGSVAAGPGDWIFAGALRSALDKSPLSERYDVLTHDGLWRDAGADAVVLSMHSETEPMLRHRRLDYVLKCHGFRIAETGPAIHAWLQADFEPVEPAPDGIRQDLVALIDAVRGQSETQFLILNCMSSSGRENIYSYAPFDRPMRRTLTTIRSKELNLMLYDLARERDIAIVDVDAIAAEIGAAAHLPDGVHASGLLQAETRAEMLRILHARGVSGFAPAGVR